MRCVKLSSVALSNKPGMTIPISVNFDPDADEEAEERKAARSEVRPRAIYIQKWMLDNYGYTEGCPGCNAKRAGLSTCRDHTAAAS